MFSSISWIILYLFSCSPLEAMAFIPLTSVDSGRIELMIVNERV